MSVPPPPTFVETEHQKWAISLTATILACASLLLSSFIIIAASLIWTNKKARNQLDRISFRLCLWAMGAQVVYDISHITVFAPTDLISFDDTGCAAGMTIRVAMLGLVNYLFTCIAVNLMVTIVFGITPVEYHLEYYYVGTSFVLALLVPIIAACLGHFGKDPIFDGCYFAAGQRETRLKHFITDLYLWQALTCVIATVSVVVTMMKLYNSSRITKKANKFGTFTSGPDVDFGLQSCTHVASSSSNGPFRRLFGKPSISCTCPPGSHSMPESGKTSILSGYQMDANSMTMYQLQDKLKGVALKISLYPVALIVINAIVTFGDVYTAITHGVNTRSGFVLTTIHRALCGGRGIIFAALCIFVDPCLFRGLRILIEERRKAKARHIETLDHHDAEESQYEPEKGAVSPGITLPHLDHGYYSPTCILPHDRNFGRFSDTLILPDAMSPNEQEWKFGDDSSFGQNKGRSSEEKSRKSSAVSLDFLQFLSSRRDSGGHEPANTPSGFAGESSGRKQKKSSKDLSNSPSRPRSPTNAASPTSPVAAVLTSSQPAHVLRLPTSDRSESNGSVDIGQMLASAPGAKDARDRGSSAKSMDIGDALDTLPTSHHPFIQPYNSIPSNRQPSLPNIWKGAFDASAGREQGLGAMTNQQRNAERARLRREEKERKEYLRTLEKLYEEAESQL